MKRIYLAGPMTGKPLFNYDAFMEAATLLRATPGNIVFNPVERDVAVYDVDLFFGNPEGDPVKAAEAGFDIREALAADLAFIILHADAIAILPGWETSRGVLAEKAAAEAVSLEIIYL